MKSIKPLLIGLAVALFGCTTTLSTVTPLEDPKALEGMLHEEGVVVLTVWGADWCSYCEDFDKEIPRLQEKYGSDLRIVKIDTDKYPLSLFGIEDDAIPFFLVSLNGEALAVGTGDAKDVEEILDEAVVLLKSGADKSPKGLDPL
jgi:thiol-disulfide isomerase/thioredoxin